MIISLNKFEKKEKPEDKFDVQPTTSDQFIEPTEGYVFSRGIVRAVTSDIDVNIQPENIKEGVSILSVEGTLKKEKPEEIFNIQPTTTDQAITPTEGSVFISGTVRAVTSNIDVNIQPENIKQGVSILGVEGTLTEGAGGESNVFVVPPEIKFGFSTFTEIPSNFDFRMFSNVTDASYMFAHCSNLTSIPSLNTSNMIDASSMFTYCSNLTTIPSLNTSNMTNASSIFDGCSNLTTVEGIDFSGLTSDLTNLFGWTSDMQNLSHFIVNGKINVSISDEYSIKALTAIDYDSVKSILAAANRTDNTNEKTLAFNRTMTDQNGELATLVTSCTSKGWIITGLTIE